MEADAAEGLRRANRAASAQVEFHEFSFAYAGAREMAVRDVTLSASGGGIISVLGPRGAGKTTLLRAIAGLLGPIYPGRSSGTAALRISGAPVSRDDTALFVSSYFDSDANVTLLFDSVGDEISSAVMARGASAEEASAALAHTAGHLGIRALLRRRITELSGGEQKLVSLTAALAPNAPIYLMDEPFDQLDPEHVREVVKALKDRVRAGALVILATNNVDIALNASRTVWAARDGGWIELRDVRYADVAPMLGESSASPILDLVQHGAPRTAFRTFREAARLVVESAQ